MYWGAKVAGTAKVQSQRLVVKHAKRATTRESQHHLTHQGRYHGEGSFRQRFIVKGSRHQCRDCRRRGGLDLQWTCGGTVDHLTLNPCGIDLDVRGVLSGGIRHRRQRRPLRSATDCAADMIAREGWILHQGGERLGRKAILYQRWGFGQESAKNKRKQIMYNRGERAAPSTTWYCTLIWRRCFVPRCWEACTSALLIEPSLETAPFSACCAVHVSARIPWSHWSFPFRNSGVQDHPLNGTHSHAHFSYWRQDGLFQLLSRTEGGGWESSPRNVHKSPIFRHELQSPGVETSA